MTFNFPEIKFVKDNTLVEQVRHMREELEELEEAIVLQECRDRVTEEAMDLLHSTETFLRMMREDGVNLDERSRFVTKKNTFRGYYSDPQS